MMLVSPSSSHPLFPSLVLEKFFLLLLQFKGTKKRLLNRFETLNNYSLHSTPVFFFVHSISFMSIHHEIPEHTPNTLLIALFFCILLILLLFLLFFWLDILLEHIISKKLSFFSSRIVSLEMKEHFNRSKSSMFFFWLVFCFPVFPLFFRFEKLYVYILFILIFIFLSIRTNQPYVIFCFVFILFFIWILMHNP